jgi:hypothetical protein
MRRGSSRTGGASRLLLALAAGALISLGAQAQGVRAEVGRPLQQASELLKANKAREALAKVREAEAVGNKTAAETLMVDRMKAAAAQRAGDFPTAIQALEAVHGRLSGAEQGAIAEQIAAAYVQTRNNAKGLEWLNRAKQAGHNSPTMRQLEQFLQSAGGDYAAIARDAAAAVAAAEQGGRRPEEGDLLRLADAQQRTGNNNGYIATLEKLLLNYPKRDYWNAYLGRLPRKSGFSDRFALDVMRLRLASGTLTKTEEFMEMAQLALQAGVPGEARRIVEQGYNAKLLGSGAEAERHKRLRDLTVKQEADAKTNFNTQLSDARAEPEGDALVRLGYSQVTLGNADQGIKLIEEGIAKGKLRRPEDARLRLGMAMLQSGKNRAAALQVLRGIKGADGASDIARLWTVVNPGGG